MSFIIKKFKRYLQVSCRCLASFISPNWLRVALWRSSGLSIGMDTYIGKRLLYIHSSDDPNILIIEDRAGISYNVTIITESSPIWDSKNRSGLLDYDIISRGKVRIMHDTWIGTGVIILPNVTVHEFSIIGSGAVVTKDVPAYSIVAGVPAKVIKKLERKHEDTH